jgi:hypothetical protein
VETALRERGIAAERITIDPVEGENRDVLVVLPAYGSPAASAEVDDRQHGDGP